MRHLDEQIACNAFDLTCEARTGAALVGPVEQVQFMHACGTQSLEALPDNHSTT